MQPTSNAPQLDQGIPRPGAVIGGKYVVDGLVGRRGAAIVLGARRLRAGEPLSIAVLPPEWGRHTILADRFLRDGETAMRIRSEHAVRVFDQGVLDGGAPYRVLEHVEGPSLRTVVSRCGRLPVPTAVDWMLQAMEAIAQAHSYGVAHGDLTPAMLLLTRRRDGTACIKVDFGLRGATGTPARDVGDPGAPWNVDLRADLRALGGVLHVLLTGEPPVGRAVAMRGALPRPLEIAVRRCLEEPRHPGFSGVAELARWLAPFGTRAARASCERVECLLEDRVSVLTPRTPSPVAPIESTYSEPPPVPRGRPFAAPASGKVVVVGLAMLTALGAAAFASMYLSVPRGAAPSVGVAAMQPTGASSTRQVPASPARDGE